MVGELPTLMGSLVVVQITSLSGIMYRTSCTIFCKHPFDRVWFVTTRSWKWCCGCMRQTEKFT